MIVSSVNIRPWSYLISIKSFSYNPIYFVGLNICKKHVGPLTERTVRLDYTGQPQVFFDIFFLKALVSESLKSKFKVFHNEVPIYRQDFHTVSFLGFNRLIFLPSLNLVFTP